MQIETTRFGTLEVAEHQMLHFPDGILGFEGTTHYVLIDMADEGPFKWLQAVSDPDLAFVVTDPRAFWTDFHPVITDRERSAPGLEEDVYFLSIVAVPDDPLQATTNLYAPLAIHAQSRQARQLVLIDSAYSLHEPLFSGSAQAAGL